MGHPIIFTQAFRLQPVRPRTLQLQPHLSPIWEWLAAERRASLCSPPWARLQVNRATVSSSPCQYELHFSPAGKFRARSSSICVDEYLDDNSQQSNAFSGFVIDYSLHGNYDLSEQRT